MKNKLLVLITLASFQYADGQISWKNWDGVQWELGLSRKIELRLSHLRAFDLSGSMQPDFNQTSIQLSYELLKRLELSGGYTFAGNNSLTDGASRVFAKVSLKKRLLQQFNWTNALQGEVHSIQESRYKNRLIFTSRLATRKRISLLKLLPSVGYSLFYNIGGKPIQYYDKVSGMPTIINSPDGFHRGRLTISVNTKLSNTLSVSVFYMAQREFNLLSPVNREINVTNPLTGKIVRPFDDFNVIGMTISIDTKLYKTSKKK